VNARVAIAELDQTRARDCIAKGLSAMEGFEVPLAAWRIHATAFELYKNSGDRDSAKRHLALSRETIMKLTNSLPAEEPLRQTFLSAPMIRNILSDRNATFACQRGLTGARVLTGTLQPASIHVRAGIRVKGWCSTVLELCTNCWFFIASGLALSAFYADLSICPRTKRDEDSVSRCVV
jgi:hypothetical protein